MPPAPIPSHERKRLAALRSYDVLDTSCDSAFDNLADLAAEIIGCPVAAVSLIDADRQWFKARHGLEVSETPRDYAFCAYTILSHEPLIVPDATCDPRFADNPFVTNAPNVRFYAGVPLVNQDNLALGTLCVIDTQPRAIDKPNIRTLKTLAQAVMAILELRRAMQRVQRLATTDALTGLANRSAFLIALGKAILYQRRSRGTLNIMYLDLDGFKRVNDTEGHQAGDQVLREVAAVLRKNVRQEDVVARLGGDEFAVIFTGGDDPDGRAGERLRAAIQARMAASGRPITASVGSVCFHTPPSNPTVALAEVDKLMYEAKAGGKNRVSHRNWRPGLVCDVSYAAD